MTRAFVCRCEDVDRDEVMEAIEEGYDDLESLRRFTALGTGPCQGKACLDECVRLLARTHGVNEAQVGLMTLRPPVVPIPMGLLAALEDADVESVMSADDAATSSALRDAAAAPDALRTGRATPESRAQGLHAAEDGA